MLVNLESNISSLTGDPSFVTKKPILHSNIPTFGSQSCRYDSHRSRPGIFLILLTLLVSRKHSGSTNFGEGLSFSFAI